MSERPDEEKAVALAADAPIHIPASSGSTLLPASIASIVSLGTQSSSLVLWIGSTIGGLAIDGARLGTLTSLELGRSAAEAILVRAGRDVKKATEGNIGQAEAEGILERCV
jgi:hypothetical protein